MRRAGLSTKLRWWQAPHPGLVTQLCNLWSCIQFSVADKENIYDIYKEKEQRALFENPVGPDTESRILKLVWTHFIFVEEYLNYLKMFILVEEYFNYSNILIFLKECFYNKILSIFNKNYQIVRVNKQRRTLFLLLQNFLPFNLDLLSWQIDCIIMCTLSYKRRRGCLMFTFQHVSTLWKKKRKICSNLFCSSMCTTQPPLVT